MANKELPKRNEVPVELTWRLEDIFETDELWNQEYEDVKKRIPDFALYNGKLSDSSQTLLELAKLQDNILERTERLYTYAHMRYDQDTTNSFYQAMNSKAQSLFTFCYSSMSYIVPEILSMKEGLLEKFIVENHELSLYKKALEDITRMRPHVLSEREETILAEASEPLSTPSQTFGMLNNADISFPAIKDENGEEITLTHGRYIKFMESKDRNVRKAAFEALYDTYDKYKNTFASTLSGAIKAHNFMAKVRNYHSARHAALNNNHIPESVYDNLIEAVHEKLPLLHRYISLRKKVLGVTELHMYDIYTTLVQNVEMNITFNDAKEIVKKGLSPLGEDYGKILKGGMDSRWIDVLENKGKRSGAYSSGSYGTNPYILLNWTDNVDNTFTLAHELGHSMHSYYTRNNQPYRYGDYSIFVAEVASTCNEALLNDYLLKNLKDENEILYILNNFLDGFRGTVFRQTMFAEFEHEIHVQSQNGVALTAEKLTEIYYNLNKKYYGDDIISDERIGLEWAKIPHFYYNYYVYQYATGYSAATALANQILTSGESAVKRYKNFLKAGSSDYPIEVLKKAGVDMTSKQPIIDALNVFEKNLVKMEQLLLKK